MNDYFELRGPVDSGHNSEAEYSVGGPQLSFEFRQAKANRLSFATAQRIFDWGGGLGAVVTPLINSGATTPEGVDNFIKALGLWKEGDTQGTKDALADHFLK